MAENSLIVSEERGITFVRFSNGVILDPEAVGAISKDLLALADEPSRRRLVLDFGAVTSLSSLMLQVLLELWKKCKAIDGRFIICSMRPDLFKIFKVTRLNKVLEFADTAEQAAGRFAAVQTA